MNCFQNCITHTSKISIKTQYNDVDTLYSFCHSFDCFVFPEFFSQLATQNKSLFQEHNPWTGPQCNSWIVLKYYALIYIRLSIFNLYNFWLVIMWKGDYTYLAYKLDVINLGKFTYEYKCNTQIIYISGLHTILVMQHTGFFFFKYVHWNSV